MRPEMTDDELSEVSQDIIGTAKRMMPISESTPSISVTEETALLQGLHNKLKEMRDAGKSFEQNLKALCSDLVIEGTPYDFWSHYADALDTDTARLVFFHVARSIIPLPTKKFADLSKLSTDNILVQHTFLTSQQRAILPSSLPPPSPSTNMSSSKRFQSLDGLEEYEKDDILECLESINSLMDVMKTRKGKGRSTVNEERQLETRITQLTTIALSWAQRPRPARCNAMQPYLSIDTRRLLRELNALAEHRIDHKVVAEEESFVERIGTGVAKLADMLKSDVAKQAVKNTGDKEKVGEGMELSELYDQDMDAEPNEFDFDDIDWHAPSLEELDRQKEAEGRVLGPGA
ncbi:hypothetical protein GP486_003500 [Trichoglossum hirsutum]|uniref:Uncharacterized protein n=1 Tax=Trichoglossum hirsutum TaxID=265104 RepID=A0A9P8LCT6_9PEZI|nr:hypothetical protein GP486_003500 [Trichoglossum hirsutum]